MSRRSFPDPFFKRAVCAGPGTLRMSDPDCHALGRGEPKRKPTIKVVGVGGAGCNALGESPFETLAICTPEEDTRQLRADGRVLLKEEHLEFLRETPPRTVRSIRYELKDQISRVLGEPDLVFLFAGLGGDAGSYAAPMVANLCKKQASLCISSVALPFSVEGKDRQEVALCSVTHITESSDITITYPNDHLLKMVPNLPLRKAFGVMNSIMMAPVMELEKVLTVSDLEQVRKSFIYSQYARLGMGTGKGPLKAVDDAFTSPWFDFEGERVMSALVTVSMSEVEEDLVKEVLEDLSHRIPYARISHSSIEDPSLEGKIKVMLLLGVA
ncbi:MAG: hypothetical protein ACOCSO_01795 [Thermoplasmatota archaeon]